MKNGILAIAVFFLIIISITGIASADLSILEDNTDMKVSVITLPAGGWADLDIIATVPVDSAAMQGNMSIWVLDSEGNPVKKYIIKIEDTASGAQLAKATVEVKPLSGVSVPEFPTVALPVAVIMGLVFFFNSRKGKEKI